MKKTILISILLLISLNNFAQTLLAYYPLNGNANDSLGNLNGTMNGPISNSDRFNYLNKALNFNGTSNHVNLGNSTIIRPTNAITVSVWFELNATGALTGRNMISNTHNGGYNLQYITSGNTIRCNLRRNNVYAVINTPAAPYNNTGWHFAVLTYDGRYTKLYLDGILKGTDDAGANYPINYATATNTYIGAESNTGFVIDGNYYWKGNLDDIKIYNGALSASEIMAEYLDHNTKPIPEIGLSLWLRSDSGINANGTSINSWNDLSGHNHHASQSITSKQPSLISNGMNGKPSIHFDGVDDIMQTSSIDFSSTPRVTVFIVNKANDDGIAIETGRDVNASLNGFYIADNYENLGISAALKGNAPGPNNNYISMFKSTNTFISPKICYTMFDKTQASYLNQIKMRVNGVDILNADGYGGSHTDNFGNDSIFIGGRGNGGSSLNGDIAEILVYDRVLSTNEIYLVENYLNQRYNVSTTLAQSKPGSGNAISFDGINDYINIPCPTFTEYTLEAWVKFTGSPINKNIMTFTNAAGPTTSWSHQIRTGSSGQFAHYTYDGNGNTIQGTTIASQNKWYHVCVTAQNNGSMKLYVNGILEANANAISTLWPSGNQFRVGSNSGAGVGLSAAGFLNGEVDEIRAWNVVLSPDQIRTQMCSKISTDDSLYSHLVFDLNCDESTSSTSYDLSTNARHGTLTNGATHTTSGAPIGNSSAYNYGGSASTINLNNNSISDFTASISSGTASGIHVYEVNENPNSRIGIDSLSSNQGYFGVFVVNGIGSAYNAKFHYLGNGGFANENVLNLFKRDNNSDTTWTNSSASLNTDSNTLIVSGQNTEYYLGGNPVLSTYYHDLDGDGFGNLIDSILAYSSPSGYVSNSNDCNDLDSVEHPGQVWFIDNDMDGYGTGASIVQCSRPLHGFHLSELSSSNGDCDDTNANIYPNYQYFEFSESANFTSSLIYPLNGDSYTNFQFEVIYKNANNELPSPTFPRVLLDYEGNGIYNNTNDRTIIMNEDDINDTNTVDGKKYVAEINGLPIGTNWKTAILNNLTNCGNNFGPFNYPDVLTRPDLEIFANDITFSEPHPTISSPFTINAEIHNVSDFAAQNFVVHIIDQYNPSLVLPDITVNNLNAHSSTIVSWNITTISIPSWHPIQIIVDYTNVIDESNELDNYAIRPYINGNYNLPGSIITTANVSPSISYSGAGSHIGISGHSYYSGTAVTLIDSSVAGATINFTIVETGASYSTYTNSHGNYFYSFPKPLPAGIYHIIGTCTDFTLTGNLTGQFEVIMPVIQTCQLPDLVCHVSVDSNNIVVGHSISGNIHISNIGNTASSPTILSWSQTGGSPLLSSQYNIPSLVSNATYDIPFTLTFNATGQFSLCALVDATYLQNECHENNSSCQIINVFPSLPDIVVTGGPSGQAYQCNLNYISIALSNHGGVSTGPFNCRVNTYQSGVLINTFNHSISNLQPVQHSPSNTTVFQVPFTPNLLGNYTFEVFADYPTNEVIELNEFNNTSTYSLSVIACKPDFGLGSCQYFDAISTDGNYTQGSTITITQRIVNGGNLSYSGALDIRYSLSNGNIFNESQFVSLSPGGEVYISKDIPAPAPATTSITISVDPNNLISELNESNNSTGNSLCWDFQTVPLCGTNFWDYTYLVNQSVNLSVGISNPYLYHADTLKVKFQVSGPGLSGTLDLGNATIYNLTRTCFCPTAAILPINFAFPQTGTYTFTMTADPNHLYTECDESNNVLVKTVQVNNLPDLRILSQFISPSKLNPDPNENISMNITYENIGTSNINDQLKLKVIVDNTPLDSIYPLNGLIHHANQTIAIPTPWSSSLVGVHVIRAIIDDDNQVMESNELNNEATRAIVVGESANLYFQAFNSTMLTPYLDSSMILNTRIGNNGDLNCDADIHFYYVDDNLDTISISEQHIEVNAHDSIAFNFPWTVSDNSTTLIARILNSSILEYTYDDNEKTFTIGDLQLMIFSEPYCDYGSTIGYQGYLHASGYGGTPPYSYFWNTGSQSNQLVGSVGNYTVTMSDSKGQSISSTSHIDSCSNVFLNVELLLQGYYIGNHQMKPTLKNQGIKSWDQAVDSVTIELRKDSITYPLKATYKGIVSKDGILKAYFSANNLIGTECYIVVKHRNSIDTWSSIPISITSSCSYNFSDNSTKAYGNNQTPEVELNNTYYAIYTGDINQDNNIDLLDNILLETSAGNFESGYIIEDLNGDGNVDLLDLPVLEENISSFIYGIRPE